MSNNGAFKKSAVVRIDRKRYHNPTWIEQTTDSGYKFRNTFQQMVRAWSEESEVEMVIDMEKLFSTMATRGIENKGGKATLAEGMIVARVRSRRESGVTDAQRDLPPNCVKIATPEFRK